MFFKALARRRELLLQQRGSRLRDCVTVGSYTGKAAKVVEQIGAVTALNVRSIPQRGAMSLASVVALLLWLYITAQIFLLGGALNAEGLLLVI